MRRSLGLAATLAFTLALVGRPAGAQPPPPEHPTFGHMLIAGTGLIGTPHAMVPKTSLFATFTAVPFDRVVGNDYTLFSGSAGLTLGRFIEVGATLYHSDAYAAFGKVQLVQQRGIFPSIAGGVLNAGNDGRGRYGIEDDNYDDIDEAISIFGVMSYAVGPGMGRPLSWILFSAGWGTGLFERDNPAFANEGSGGLFGSAAFDFRAGDRAFIRAILEYDGFDVNIAATAYLAGLELTLGILSVDEGEALTPPEIDPADPTRSGRGVFYNQAKGFVSISMDARVLGVLPWIWTTEER